VVRVGRTRQVGKAGKVVMTGAYLCWGGRGLGEEEGSWLWWRSDVVGMGRAGERQTRQTDRRTGLGGGSEMRDMDGGEGWQNAELVRGQVGEWRMDRFRS